MRKQLIHLINTEIKNAKAKKTAGIIAKLNSLSDVKIINKLSNCSQFILRIITMNNIYSFPFLFLIRMIMPLWKSSIAE